MGQATPALAADLRGPVPPTLNNTGYVDTRSLWLRINHVSTLAKCAGPAHHRNRHRGDSRAVLRRFSASPITPPCTSWPPARAKVRHLSGENIFVIRANRSRTQLNRADKSLTFQPITRRRPRGSQTCMGQGQWAVDAAPAAEPPR